MDTTQKYIDMSHQAYLLKKDGFGGAGVVYYCKCGKEWWAPGGHCPIKAEALGHWRVWLPTQEEMQKILKIDSSRSYMGLLNDITSWLKDIYPASKKMDSMEQLWLGYLMYKRYNLKWDGRSGWIPY